MKPLPDMTSLKVVLSHDWLTGMRGGERVLDILCRQFPDAPIFTLIHNSSALSGTINSHRISTSWLQTVPGIMRHYRLLLPLFPGAVERMECPPTDLLLSTSHCVAKGLRPPTGSRHLCYCFTPMRYAWGFHAEYFGKNPLISLLMRPLLSHMREWDRRTASRVDHFVAISRHVHQRIRTSYGRDSDIVYPPVHLDQWTPSPTCAGGFDLIVSALVPYKRIDLAVRVYNRLGFPLKIVGVGTCSRALQTSAKGNVELLGWRSDADLLDLYRNCRMLVFPGEEDFGIVPLEAQACGRPVVAYGMGGALETVSEGLSGVFFEEQAEASLLDAIARCADHRWDTLAIRAHAEQFGVDRFVSSLMNSIRLCLGLKIGC